MKEAIRRLENRANEFFELGLIDLSEQYFKAAQLLLSCYTLEEYNKHT